MMPGSRVLAIFSGAILLLLPLSGIHAAEPGPLVQAVLADDLVAVRAALAAGAPADAIDPAINHAPLHIAVAPGGPRDADLVDLLVKAGARPDALDPATGLTPLAAAMVVTERGPFAVLERSMATNLVDRLLQAGANPNRILSNGGTPLMLAVSMNNLPATRLLLARGANPRLRDENQTSALHIAYAANRPTEFIDALLAAGADPTQRDAQGKTPQELGGPPSAPVAAVPASPPSGESVVAQATNNQAEPGQTSNPPRSSLSNWLIGGAVAAGVVVGSVVLANLVKQQKKKKANNATSETSSTSALTAAMSSALAAAGSTGNQAAPPQSEPIPPKKEPAPPVLSPPERQPGQIVATAMFNGNYSSSELHPDGFMHSEKATVSGAAVTLTKHVKNTSGTGASATIQWTGSLRPRPDNPKVADISGSGTIDNVGVRSFVLSSGSVQVRPDGSAQLFWSAADPRLGTIGGGARRAAGGMISILPIPVPSPTPPRLTPPAPAPSPAPGLVERPPITVADLSLMHIVQGQGSYPFASDTVKVHLRGSLSNGTEFQNTLRSGVPMSMSLANVIPCMRTALQRIRVGGQARLTCPPNLAYGERGAPPNIPPQATLLFDVSLLEIVK